MRHTLLALGFGLLVAYPAAAQAPAKPPVPVTAPDATTLEAAREVVAKMQGDRTTALSTISGPMVSLVQRMGVREPDRAQAPVQEVMLPVLTAHYDELLDVQARSFAGVLGGSELRAISSFYDTPAGKALAKAQPQLAQAQLTGMTQWMGNLMPELQVKTMQAIKAYGWDKAAPAR